MLVIVLYREKAITQTQNWPLALVGYRMHTDVLWGADVSLYCSVLCADAKLSMGSQSQEKKQASKSFFSRSRK